MPDNSMLTNWRDCARTGIQERLAALFLTARSNILVLERTDDLANCIAISLCSVSDCLLFGCYFFEKLFHTFRSHSTSVGAVGFENPVALGNYVPVATVFLFFHLADIRFRFAHYALTSGFSLNFSVSFCWR